MIIYILRNLLFELRSESDKFKSITSHQWRFHMSKKETNLPRRKFISNTAMLGAAVFAPPFIKSAGAADSLKVGTYGGYFEESFVKYIYPEFTKETGIEIQSVPEPTGSTWLIQLKNAAKAGVAPADVSMMA